MSGIDGINNSQQTNQVAKSEGPKASSKSSSPAFISMKNIVEGGVAQKKITQEDIENALNEPRPGKAMLGMLEKSPVGLGNQQSREEIENLGYFMYETAYHIGAAVVYKSNDGGTITVYNGKGSAEMGENERKTVYENGNYRQESFYDESGKLIRCEIRIKNEITGATDSRGKFTMFYNEQGKRCFVN